MIWLLATSFAYYVISWVLLDCAAWLIKHRAQGLEVAFAPYLSLRGRALVIAAYPWITALDLLFAMFILACAVEHTVHITHTNPLLMDVVRGAEAAISSATAGVIVFVRYGRDVWKSWLH